MKRVLNAFIRYLILIIIAIPNLWIFYKIFTPLTIYPVFFLLSLFYKAELIKNIIIIQDISIALIPACIAGSAYYLLTILNLSIPEIKINKRIKMLLFGFVLLLILNILRIVLLSIFAINNSNLFNIAHLFFWYFLSTLFVAGIWFLEITIFKIKQIPFYSDIKYILSKK